MKRAIGNRGVAIGFTLIELLVVVTIIVVLLALLTPALDKAIESAQRVVCGANLKVISSASVQYAMANRKQLFLPRGREVTLAFDPKGTQAHSGTPQDAQVDWPAALASVGLASSEKQQMDDESIHGGLPDDPLYKDNIPGKMWDCPTRVGDWKTYWATSPLFQPTGFTLLTGYQYLGGVAIWRNPFVGAVPNPPSPKTLRDPGNRALATDVTAKAQNKWGGRPGNLQEGEGWYLAGTPAHRDENNRPIGQNQTYLDASVEFVDASKLYMFHTWNNSAVELFFFWQQDFGGRRPSEGEASWARNQ